MKSPGNQGVFQLLKEVSFRRIPAFCSAWKRKLSRLLQEKIRTPMDRLLCTKSIEQRRTTIGKSRA